MTPAGVDARTWANCNVTTPPKPIAASERSSQQFRLLGFLLGFIVQEHLVVSINLFPRISTSFRLTRHSHCWRHISTWLALGLTIATSAVGCRPVGSVSVGNAASSGETANENAAANETLRVLVLEDKELSDVLQREWRARSEGKVEFKNRPVAEFLEEISDGRRRLDTDVVVFPTNLLGELAERKLIRQLPQKLVEEPGFNRLEIFGLTRSRETQWNGKPYAVPFGSAPLMLLVRTDLVGPSDIPTDWAELEATALELQQSGRLGSDTAALLQPLGAGWGARLLLARAAGYAFDETRVSTVFDYRTLEPKIDSPPFARALAELQKSCGIEATSQLESTPSDVLRAFIAGKCAMAITWPSAAKGELAAVEFPVAIVELPGTTERYDAADQVWVPKTGDLRVTTIGINGRLAAISRAARGVEEATRFLGWASGPDQSGRICARSAASGPFRQSHLASPQAWVAPCFNASFASDYASAAEQSWQRSASYLAPRLPGQQKYMQALDAAVARAVLGEQSTSDALQSAADQWGAITQQLGQEKQTDAYNHSLGIVTP